jgi:ferric-dicitrate binding protein FerR (iron transport regulator)
MQRHDSNIKQLLIDFITGEIDSKEKKQVKDWINSSAENQKYFHHLRDVWESAATKNPHTKLSTDKSWKRIYKKIHSAENKEKNVYTLLKIAAVFILAFAMGMLVDSFLLPFGSNTVKEKYNITETPRGAKSKVILADGTVVWLNADSRLKYPAEFTGKQRTVELQGEGFFDVKTDEKRPFIVQASGIKIQALGTSFNVKAYEEEETIETTLVEGLVSIQKESENKQVFLKPNQKATFYKENNTRIVESVNSNEASEVKNKPQSNKIEEVAGKLIVDEKVETIVNTSWKDNQWIIRNKTLGELSVEIERKYDVSISFNSDELKQFRYSGTLEDEPLAQVLSLISMTSPLKYRMDGKKVMLLEDKLSKEKYRNVYNE